MFTEVPLIGVVTVSDRAGRGEYEDRSGPAVEAVLREFLLTECEFERRIVVDETALIVQAIRDLADRQAALICTTGGTGPAPRDVTPEAMLAVCEKELPGFGELMRRVSIEQGVPTAILSRQTAGIVSKSLVVNLPGKPEAIRTCLTAVFPAVPDCIDLLGGPYLKGNPQAVQVYRPTE